MNEPSEESRRLCSTPFGIEEGITQLSLGHASKTLTCSTPFGIEEGITP